MKLGKKLLSLLTVLCLTLSLFPTMALADGNVSVGGTGTSATSVSVAGKTLNENTPYLVKNENTYNNSQSQVEGATYATFDANTGTLTLNNYNYTGTSGISSTGGLTINLVGINTITTSGDNSIYSTGALTITSGNHGILTTSSTNSSTTIYAKGNIAIKGNAVVNATINGDAQAINSDSASGKITIEENAVATATNINNVNTVTDSIAILAGNNKAKPTGTIEVKDSATLTAKGYGKALACKSMSETSSPKGFTYPDGSTIKVSKNYDGSNPETTYAEGSLGSYKYVEVTHAVVNYDVWVGGTQVTSANKDDVLGNGKVTYTPASTSGEETTPQKLTLNGAVIESGSEKGIKASDDLVIDLKGENQITGTNNLIYLETSGSGKNLTITSTSENKGTLTLDSVSVNSTVYADGGITINGYATVSATNGGNAQVLHSPSGNITITGNAKVTAKNTRTLSGQTSASKEDAHSVALLTGSYPENASSTITGTITVSESASLLAQGSTQALMCGTFTYPERKARASTNYTGANPVTYNSSNLATYKYVEVAPVEEYDVWVGGTQINSSNASDVLGNSSGISYEPTTQTLTLTNATITGAPSRKYTSTITDACGIYAKHDLKVALVGSSTINRTPTEQLYGSYGIFVEGRLTFTEGSSTSTTESDPEVTPSITVSGGTSSNSGNAWVPGVYASGITVKNCNVTAMGGTASDSYPVAYAMSKAPTLVGAKVTETNTTNSATGATKDNYSASSISRYKYLKIEKTTEEDTTVAAPVITPEGGYVTSDPNVTISCPMSGVDIYYTTNDTDPTTSGTKYEHAFSIAPSDAPITVKAIAVKTVNGQQQQSAPVEAKFSKREPGNEVTKVALSVDVNTHTTNLKVGDRETLSAAVKHEETPIDGLTVTWTSDNEEVATVVGGVITAKSVGKARVTAAVVENGVTYSDFCDVIVEARPSSSHHSSSSTTYYDVNAAVSGEGGSVAAGTKRASRGTTVSVTATPESGYQVAQVSAVDKDGKTVSLTDKGDGVYTFVMPASKVDVTARFAKVQKPEEKDPYGDVSKDSYYYDAVKWAAETGVTTGVGDGLFAPEWVCTRGQIVTFLWRASGSPAPKATELPFTDVAADAYYAQAVLWAVENGITNGTSETTFSPDQTCTRAHAVAFLYRMSGSPAAAGSTFSDVAADAYYRAAVAWAVEKGITNGTSGTTFSPDDTCTRGQIVTFLYRLAQTK